MIKILTSIQSELKAPKGQYNNFGKYKYRSCEDILEAVKPILAKHGAALTLTDSIEFIGSRFYVKATATLRVEGKEPISVSAYAREDEQKKGMDGSQITGTASSYARKYALNGLFCIDDTKDEDSNELKEQTEAKAQAEKKTKNPQELAKATAQQLSPDKTRMQIIRLFKSESEQWQKNTLENWKLEKVEDGNEAFFGRLENHYRSTGKL